MEKLKMFKVYLKSILLISLSLIFYFTGHTIEGVIMFLIYLVDNFYTLNCYWKKQNNVDDFCKEINKNIEGNACNLSFPIVVIKYSGELIWFNERFSELINNKSDILGKNIASIARGLDFEELLKDEDSQYKTMKYNGTFYKVYSRKIKHDGQIFAIIYFNDIGELIEAESAKESIILLEVDNLNDVLEITEENDRPLLIAEIQRKINAYAHKLNAMIKKYDNSKYVLSVQDKYIEEQIEENFTILDEISDINRGSKVEVTLSMGIGRGGASPMENDTFATLAKELALGRGGDQVVIKNKDEIKFFGGNTKEIEKRTRVRARVISHALKELIYESSKVYIIGHKNADMDCLGSATALASAVKKLGKECNIILNGSNASIEYFYGKLLQNEEYKTLMIEREDAERELDEDTLVIIVDVHNKSYVDNISIVEKAKKKVIIDHHRRSPDIIGGTLLNYIEVYASSTSEMITEILQYIVEKPKLTNIEANGLLAGIYMDTKGFSFKTGVRTFDAASFLKSQGADTIEAKKMVTDNLEDFVLIADIIKSAEVDPENNIAIAICPNNVNNVIVAKAADELLNISGIFASFVLARIEDAIYISGRSVDDINVQVILEELGGGGHMNIAGARLENYSMSQAIIALKESINKHVRIGEQ